MKNLIFAILIVITVNAQSKDSIIKTGVVHNTSPVGAIITSILDYDTFKSLNPNTYQNYVLCDGRRIDESSAYYLKDVRETAPDLRGLFVRGVNKMDEGESVKVTNVQMNPEDKKAGEFQRDAYTKHKHSIWTAERHEATNNLRKIPSHFNNTANNNGSLAEYYSEYSGYASETRPKNMSVYYYLKIN